MTDNRLLIGYYRLSMEDDTDNESNSITNQRLLIKDYISAIPELLAMPYQEFYDDGYSGASMERPAMQHGTAACQTKSGAVHCGKGLFQIFQKLY